MLAHVLALTVGLGSFTLYMAAFFFPEVHRKHDFFWSGLGMFYALVLWTAAGQITGAVLIGQTTSVVLLGWLGWQTLVLRRVKTPLDLQTPATAESWRGFREEVTTLFQDFAAQTPVGRLLGFKRQPAGAAAGSGQVKIRASSIRDVGYEFLDDLEEPIEPARGTKAASQGAPQPVSLQRSPQPTPDSAPAPSPPQPTSTPARAKPTRPPKAAAEKAVSTPRPPAAPPPARPKGTVGQTVEKAVVLKNWLVDLAGSFSRPKPSKPVIEIPPREPSIPLQRKKPVRNPAPVVVRDELDLEDDAFWGEEADEAISENSSVLESVEKAAPNSVDLEPEHSVETTAINETLPGFAESEAEHSAETTAEEAPPSLLEPDAEPEPLVEAIGIEETSSGWTESEYASQPEILPEKNLPNLTEPESPVEAVNIEEVTPSWTEAQSEPPAETSAIEEEPKPFEEQA